MKKIIRKKRNVKILFEKNPESTLEFTPPKTMEDIEKEWSEAGKQVPDSLRKFWMRFSNCADVSRGVLVERARNNQAATRGELGTAPAHYTHGKIEPWDVVCPLNSRSRYRRFPWQL